MQVTPPGSACSICFGVGLDMMPDGAAQMIQVVVDDADAALRLPARPRRRVLGRRRAGLGPVRHGSTDPDGNRWALQQIVRARLSGQAESAALLRTMLPSTPLTKLGDSSVDRSRTRFIASLTATASGTSSTYRIS